MKSVLNFHWKDWSWSWSSNTLATWCQELTHWQRLWCWGGLKAEGEGDDRGWEGWMASLTQWTWVWVSSSSWWWTGKPSMLQSVGSQRVGHDQTAELNSHPYRTAGKTIALTTWTFVGKVMSLFFNMLSRFVIAFLPRSKCLLISWLQSPSAVILEPKKVKSLTVSIVSPSICHEVIITPVAVNFPSKLVSVL